MEVAIAELHDDGPVADSDPTAKGRAIPLVRRTGAVLSSY
jgi:hypothetical protein